MASRPGKRGGARPGAGRPNTPLDECVRAWVWYCYVRDASKCKNGRLDRLLAVEKHEPPWDSADRPQYFERLCDIATDPSQQREDRLGRPFNLVDRAEERWNCTASVFRHALWTLICPQSPELPHVQAVIEESLAKEGLRRLKQRASAAYEKHRERNDLLDRHSFILMVCLMRGTLDDLALLAALILEAALLGDRAVVDRVMVAFDEAVKKFAARPLFNYMPGLANAILNLAAEFKSRTQPTRPAAPAINHLSSIVAQGLSARRELVFEKQAERMDRLATRRVHQEFYRRMRLTGK